MFVRRRGSSPLTRGKQPGNAQNTLDPRLIPAHAGKTISHSTPCSLRWAHPRSRGENRRLIQTHPGETGSSPLTRGKLDTTDKTVNQARLIPAHAGKTLSD